MKIRKYVENKTQVKRRLGKRGKVKVWVKPIRTGMKKQSIRIEGPWKNEELEQRRGEGRREFKKAVDFCTVQTTAPLS